MTTSPDELKALVEKNYDDALNARGLALVLEHLVDEALGDNAAAPIGSAVISTVNVLVELTKKLSDSASRLDSQLN